MTKAGITRRRFVSTAAAAGITLAGARSTTYAAPAFGHTVNGRFQSDTEIVYHHIWGTPPGKVSDKVSYAEQVVNQFNEKQTGVTVLSRTDSGSYFDILLKTQAELAAGDGPDIVSTPWAFINWATEGLGLIKLEDVAGDAVSDLLDNLRPDVHPLVTIDGQTMGVPYAFSTPIMYYNQELMDQAGVDIDEILGSWDGLTGDAARTLSESVGGPILGLTDGQWPAQGIAQSNGGFIMQDDRFVMDSPETIEAMDTIAAIDREGLLNRSTRSEESASFRSGMLPICYYSVASLSNNRNSAKFDLRTHTFPAFAGKPRMMSAGGSFLGMYSRDEEKQQAAWEFLKYTVSEEGYEPWSKMGYMNATILDFPVLDGQEAAYEQLEEGITPETPWPTERGGEYGAIWAEMVSRIWLNDISADDGCRQVAEELNAAIA